MFGYVRPDLPYLYMKDSVLYRAVYCGLCVGIRKCAGNRARASLNYDMSFFSALAHNIAGRDVTIEKHRCIIHWFVPRAIAMPDELTEKVAALNLILAYFKLTDDVIDGGRGRVRRRFLRKGYRRSRAKCPELDEIVRARYEELRELEKSGCDSVDRAADPFGKMLEDCGALLVGEEHAGENERDLFYLVGKWVYLIDALDDYDKDKKRGNYNPFRAAYGSESAEKLREERGGEIRYLFESLFARIRECVKEIPFRFNHDMTDNVLLRGIPQKTASIYNKGCTKCKMNSTKFSD